MSREKVSEWLLTAALGFVGAVVLWSGGVVFASGDTIYRDAVDIERQELRPLERSLDAADTLSALLDRIMNRAGARTDTIRILASTSATYDKLPKKQRDSLLLAVYRTWEKAGEDSSELSALSGLVNSSADAQLLSASLVMLGREREWWQFLSNIIVSPNGRNDAHPPRAFDDGFSRYAAARTGFLHASQRNREFMRIELLRAREMANRALRIRRAARKKLWIAVVIWPLSIGALASLISYARTGSPRIWGVLKESSPAA